MSGSFEQEYETIVAGTVPAARAVCDSPTLITCVSATLMKSSQYLLLNTACHGKESGTFGSQRKYHVKRASFQQLNKSKQSLLIKGDT